MNSLLQYMLSRSAPEPMPNDYDYNRALEYNSGAPRQYRHFNTPGVSHENLLPATFQLPGAGAPPEEEQMDESFIQYLLNGPDRPRGVR